MKSAISVGALMIILLNIFSCHPGKKGIFGKSQSAHEKYTERLDKAGLLKSNLARQWIGSAQKSLVRPMQISVPHKEAGYFAADTPEATGLVCNFRRGATVNISVQITSADSAKVFVELWAIDTLTNERNRLAEGDSTFYITHEVEKDGMYLIRLQPELLASLEYTLTISTQASLAFPVSESGKPAMISFWNDRRDAGRNHEGVDIKATFRTPAISAADGYVRSVTTNNLGGKVVFMRPAGKDYTLYYAHLDSQTVSSGQTVSKGDTIGLIGNTGNAINTPPHLHFGIYSRGAVDPLPFIDNRQVQMKEISASRSNLNKFVRANKKARIYQLPNQNADTTLSIQHGTVMKIISATSNWYRVQLRSNTGYIKDDLITDKPLNEIKTDTLTRLLDEPLAVAASMMTIPANTNVTVYGTTDNFYLVKYKNAEGWIEK